MSSAEPQSRFQNVPLLTNDQWSALPSRGRSRRELGVPAGLWRGSPLYDGKLARLSRVPQGGKLPTPTPSQPGTDEPHLTLCVCPPPAPSDAARLWYTYIIGKAGIQPQPVPSFPPAASLVASVSPRTASCRSCSAVPQCDRPSAICDLLSAACLVPSAVELGTNDNDHHPPSRLLLTDLEPTVLVCPLGHQLVSSHYFSGSLSNNWSKPCPSAAPSNQDIASTPCSVRPGKHGGTRSCCP